MIVFFEGLILSFWLLLICVVGIAKDGPVGLVVLYEQEVQDRVVEMGGDTYRFSGIGSDYFRGYNSVDVADVLFNYPVHLLSKRKVHAIRYQKNGKMN